MKEGLGVGFGFGCVLTLVTIMSLTPSAQERSDRVCKTVDKRSAWNGKDCVIRRETKVKIK